MSEERPKYTHGGARPGSGAPQGNTNAQRGKAPRKRWTARLDPATIAKIARLAKEQGISQGELIDNLIDRE